MSIPRGGQSAALLRDGRVLVAGGISNGRVVATAELYDPRSGRFTRTGRMAIARYKTAGVTLRDGRVLIIGGAPDVDGNVQFSSTEVFDPVTGRFRTGPPMHMPRYKLTQSVVLLPDGSVVVAGGALQVELYDARARRFRLVPGPLDRTRLFLTAAALPGGRVLLVGGYDRGIRPTARSWIYRP